MYLNYNQFVATHGTRRSRRLITGGYACSPRAMQKRDSVLRRMQSQKRDWTYYDDTASGYLTSHIYIARKGK